MKLFSSLIILLLSELYRHFKIKRKFILFFNIVLVDNYIIYFRLNKNLLRNSNYLFLYLIERNFT